MMHKGFWILIGLSFFILTSCEKEIYVEVPSKRWLSLVNSDTFIFANKANEKKKYIVWKDILWDNFWVGKTPFYRKKYIYKSGYIVYKPNSFEANPYLHRLDFSSGREPGSFKKYIIYADLYDISNNIRRSVRIRFFSDSLENGLYTRSVTIRGKQFKQVKENTDRKTNLYILASPDSGVIAFLDTNGVLWEYEQLKRR